MTDPSDKITKSDSEWQAQLSSEAYRVARHEGTERPFTSPLLKEKEAGDYCCIGCGNAVFASDSKFDSGTGWPSFFQPITPEAIETRSDRSLFMRTRTEVHCAKCESHLGHVFPDGPPPTGQRYCINGVVLTFEGKNEE